MRLFSTGIRTMTHNTAARPPRWSVLLFGCLVVAFGGTTIGSCARLWQVQTTPPSSSRAVAGTTGHALIPLPVSVAMTPGQSFAIGPQTAVYVPAGVR